MLYLYPLNNYILVDGYLNVNFYPDIRISKVELKIKVCWTKNRNFVGVPLSNGPDCVIT